ALATSRTWRRLETPDVRHGYLRSRLMGHSSGTVTGRYIHAVDALLIMAADTVAGHIQGLLDGKTFRRTTYALDRASREAALARLLEQSVTSATKQDEQRIAA